MLLQGIDVSVYQGTIDWQRVAADGIRFAIIRAGAGQTNDTRCAENIRNAAAAGIAVGLYWFSYATSPAEAEAEAKRLLRSAVNQPITFPLAYDYEEASVRYAEQQGIRVTRTLVTDLTRTFCQTIESGGYTPMVYSNPSFLKQYLDFALLPKHYALWLAHWGIAEPSRPAEIWQHSSTGRVAGISTAVDLDVAYTDFGGTPMRYRTLADIPEALRPDAERLLESGALKGKPDNLDLTEDMLRCMIVSMRYTDHALQNREQA